MYTAVLEVSARSKYSLPLPYLLQTLQPEYLHMEVHTQKKQKTLKV